MAVAKVKKPVVKAPVPVKKPAPAAQPDSSSGEALAAVKTEYYAFNMQLDEALTGRTKFSLLDFLGDWWVSMTATERPDVDIPVNVIANAIRYAIVRRGYTKVGKIPGQLFTQNYEAAMRAAGGTPIAEAGFTQRSAELFRYEEVSVAGQTTVNLNKSEATMAVKKNTTANSGSSSSSKSKKTEGGPTVFGTICELLREGTHTDDDIEKTVTKKFAGRPFKRSYIAISRADINAGRRGDVPKNPIERLVDVNGKLTPASKAPKAEPTKKAHKKVDPANDPLKKLAGIDATKKVAAPAKKAAVAPVKKPAAASTPAAAPVKKPVPKKK